MLERILMLVTMVFTVGEEFRDIGKVHNINALKAGMGVGIHK